MPKPDLILLHPPSVYDFRERFAMYGPISDVIPSTPVFEMYPLGFVSMVGYLERNGYHARIINLAVKMLRDPRFDVERLIERLDPLAFGVDLHWLVHAAGSLEIAEIVKRYHPETPLLLGGLSATYYHREIIADYPQVDYVLRGDSTEESLLQLMRCLEGGKEPGNVPNLTWRDLDGRNRENSLTYVPESLDELSLDYSDMVKLVLRHRDLTGNLPFENWLDYPFTALLTCKGCLYDCITCGGSRSAFSCFFGREKPAFKSPERLVSEMKTIEGYIKGPIFLLGDLRQGGTKYASRVLKGIRREGVENTVTFELFTPAPSEYLKEIAKSCQSFTLEISPETHDDDVRRLQGRLYSTAGLEKAIGEALRVGCERMDVFFMVGLPGQTVESVRETAEYSKRLVERFSDGRVHPFIAPLAPFLDPGSLAFEDPDRYGYKRFYTTLEEHRRALLEPCWKFFLNYETRWMTRDEIADSTYEAMYRVNELKREKGLIDSDKAEKVAEGLSLARDVMHRIDEIYAATGDTAEREKRLEELRQEVEIVNRSFLYAKNSLKVTKRAGIRKTVPFKYLIDRLKRILRQ